MEMETLADVKEHYEVDENNLVRSPGKFELEPAWVVLAYEMALNGGGEGFYNPVTELTECDWWEVSSDLSEEFVSLLEEDTVGIAIFYSEQGFVSGTEMTQPEFNMFRDSIESANQEFSEMDCDW